MVYSTRLNNHIEFALIESGFQYLKRELTSVVKLNFQMSEVLNLYKTEARTAIKKAQKMGLEIQISADYDAFYSILIPNLKAHNRMSATHNLNEIKKLAEMYPDKIFLYGAFLGKKMIAGIINFICNSRVTLAFYISDNKKYRSYRPVNLLMYEVMRWAHERNFSYFDLGTISINMEINWGLGKFKETFGARGIFRDTFEIIL
jgi:lipid II:glycine glycyltransferase (peptidoglycan interpeptide bridge formation enzyme)